MAKRSGTVSITRDGVEHRGFFAIFGDLITVTYGASKVHLPEVSADAPTGLAVVAPVERQLP